MNINLSGAAAPTGKKQGKKSAKIGYGLNKRKKNVFDDGDDSDNEEKDNQADNEGDTAKSRRDAVNREIAAEQEALRKRALQAMKGQKDSSVYDYDEAYDSFQPKPKEEHAPTEEEKKSRYVEDMLKNSKRRAIERDIVYERKVAREQEEEMAQTDFQGKEKFVTKAYKRKLEERRRLAEENAKQLQKEEMDDVTKKQGGAALASFYGNLNRNVAMGGAATTVEESTKKQNDEADDMVAEEDTPSSTAPRESSNRIRKVDVEPAGDTSKRVVSSTNMASSSSIDDQSGNNNSTKESAPIQTPEEKNRLMRESRAEKLAKARARYFQRNGLTPQ